MRSKWREYGEVLVPTLLMGATLPLMIAQLVRRTASIGSVKRPLRRRVRIFTNAHRLIPERGYVGECVRRLSTDRNRPKG
jgi:hypothetical protein